MHAVMQVQFTIIIWYKIQYLSASVTCTVICVPVSGRKAIYLHDVHVMSSVFHFCKCECRQGYFDSR